jgi:hypothetical protein
VERDVPSPGVDLDREQARQFVCDWTTPFNQILGACGMGRIVGEQLRVKACVVSAWLMPALYLQCCLCNREK